MAGNTRNVPLAVVMSVAMVILPAAGTGLWWLSTLRSDVDGNTQHVATIKIDHNALEQVTTRVAVIENTTNTIKEQLAYLRGDVRDISNLLNSMSLRQHIGDNSEYEPKNETILAKNK